VVAARRGDSFRAHFFFGFGGISFGGYNIFGEGLVCTFQPSTIEYNFDKRRLGRKLVVYSAKVGMGVTLGCFFLECCWVVLVFWCNWSCYLLPVDALPSRKLLFTLVWKIKRNLGEKKKIKRKLG
jgi:hypothetical protein